MEGYTPKAAAPQPIKSHPFFSFFEKGVDYHEQSVIIRA